MHLFEIVMVKKGTQSTRIMLEAAKLDQVESLKYSRTMIKSKMEEEMEK